MKLVRWTLLFMLVSTGVIAQGIKMAGSLDQLINLPVRAGTMGAETKHLSFLKFELSEKAQKIVGSRANVALKQHKKLNAGSSRAHQLGMGNVPVLDQGGFGSCVTFANTAAVDAVLNKGDYLSQLCQLQLGRYLENTGYTYSGWDGSLGGIVLNQMNLFGVVSKDQQRANGCGGLTEYPNGGIMGFSPGVEMTPEQYHQLSENMTVGWTNILDVFQLDEDKINMDDVVAQLKTSLDAGDRLTFGVLLPAIYKGSAGAVGKHNTAYDSWVLTAEIVDDMNSHTEFPGHEMVITGYDDAAVAVDEQGRVHNGLLTLRNSWGRYAGDKGTFYMSYDYFKALAVEAQRIRGA